MEKVNHPEHYNLPGKKECIEQMMEDYGRRVTALFCLASAYKYIYRAGNKEGSSEDEDIQKAFWYFDFVNNRLFSCITGSAAVKLYNDVSKELKNKRRTYAKN